MSCPNCKLFHKECEAECCSMVPLPKMLISTNFSKITQPILKMVDVAPGVVVPITENGRCPFLQSDLGCAVYDRRPPICHKFGDETHIYMTCAYQTKDGEARAAKEKRKIQDIHTKSTNKTLGRE